MFFCKSFICYFKMCNKFFLALVREFCIHFVINYLSRLNAFSQARYACRQRNINQRLLQKEWCGKMVWARLRTRLLDRERERETLALLRIHIEFLAFGLSKFRTKLCALFVNAFLRSHFMQFVSFIHFVYEWVCKSIFDCLLAIYLVDMVDVSSSVIRYDCIAFWKQFIIL